ncbi:MAG TPA: glycosyltransferase family 39 protein, partial [Xanthomonadaceae bacterium]|nr:glycosyltransferase family 39 protein [Xanthomonadaceae bacterium]
WAIAASVGVFGSSPWAARLPIALSYLLCIWLIGRLARRLVPGSEVEAAIVYATMLLPFGASQLITTDYLLTACLTLGVWGFVEARFGRHPHPSRWIALTWAGLALGFLAKGPPALLPLLVMAAFDWLSPRQRTHRLFDAAGLLLFALLALPWFVAVIHGNPGLFEYFIGDEVINRVTTQEFGRHGEWYGWAEIYLPTLLVGSLPWTPALLRWARALPARLGAWRADADARADDAAWLLLALWLLLPLLVFCLARSRMPLYLLPLFAPLALLASKQRHAEGRALPRWPWLAAWAALLLALKLGSAAWPTHKDAAAWADAIRARSDAPVHEVVFVEDMARYGLHLHLGPGTIIEKVSLQDLPQARFNPQYDEALATELAEDEPGEIWICKQRDWPALRQGLAAHGYRALPLGAPYQRRMIFRVAPLAPANRNLR